ncbi:MAG TPA: tyrosine--tRNA ligase [Solirubrobacterales bacterium]|nr:tyrosine--tRNA ligase [Solirubrobacterales bacterium]
MTESAAAGQARRLIEGAVEALPEGRLEEQLEGEGTLRVKLGIDPTAPDIHLGHVVVLDELRAFQDAGHLVVLIIGDYTARVGDPSGRVVERPVLTEAEIAANAQTFQEQAFKVLDPDRTEVRRNSEWLAMGSDELFGLVRRFTVARLLEREEFSRRMQAEEAISLLELLYPVLQGYDSVAVEADVEVGGTDQKFNLLFGRDVQESFGLPAQSIVTMPILPGTDGVRRMSKSLGNYVGVTDAPEEMFGKLMSVPDAAMGDYYSLLLREQLDPDGHPGEAKRELARRLVERFHGGGAAADAEEYFDRLHVRHEVPEEVAEAVVEASGPNGAVHLPALLAEQFGLSRSEARRLIDQGGVRIGGRVVEAGRLDVPAAEVDGQVLQVGKRRHRRLRVAGGA